MCQVYFMLPQRQLIRPERVQRIGRGFLFPSLKFTTLRLQHIVMRLTGRLFLACILLLLVYGYRRRAIL